MARGTTSPALQVHLLPGLVDATTLRGGVVVVIDVLRATTTMAHAFHAGVTSLYPVGEIPAALLLAEELKQAGNTVLLCGERECLPIPGFDLGNSPSDFTWQRCHDQLLVMTTTNGTRAMLHARQAERVLAAGFVNFSAVCENLLDETRPIHLLCAGSHGHISLEDTLLAGAFVAALMPNQKNQLNDSARLAWDTFECHGLLLQEAFRLSGGGQQLIQAGLADDLEAAAYIDRLMIVPEMRLDDKNRIFFQIGSVGLERRLWPGK